MPRLPAFRRQQEPAPPAPARRPLPPPGVIRRERRGLVRVREAKLRDLGGLIFEMYRRSRFRDDLVTERCNELLAIDARLRELEELLAMSRRRVPAARCECGASVPVGSRFCASCGRPAGEAAVTCPTCGDRLQPDARFCQRCGSPAASVDDAGAGGANGRGAVPEGGAGAAAGQ